jgi:hypothetical protein
MKTRTNHNHRCQFSRPPCHNGNCPVAPPVAEVARDPKCNRAGTVPQIVPRPASAGKCRTPIHGNHKRYQSLSRSEPDAAEQLRAASGHRQIGQKSGLSEDLRKLHKIRLHKKLHNAHLCNLHTFSAPGNRAPIRAD